MGSIALLILINGVLFGALGYFLIYGRAAAKKPAKKPEKPPEQPSAKGAQALGGLPELKNRRLFVIKGGSNKRRVVECSVHVDSESAKSVATINVQTEDAQELDQFLDQIRGWVNDSEAQTDNRRPSRDSSPSNARHIDHLVRTQMQKRRRPPHARDRRTVDRNNVTFLVSVIPLDHAFQVDGAPFTGMAREISTAGMSFWHMRPVHSPLLAFELLSIDSPPIYAAMEICHSTAHGPYIVTGGRFKGRLKSEELIATLRKFREEEENRDFPDVFGNAQLAGSP